MKRKTNVRSHLRKTKKGPRAIRSHSRSIKRAKMAEWSSEAEREEMKETLKGLRRERKEGFKDFPENEKKTAEEVLKAFEGTLKMVGLENKKGSLKPFKRSKMARALPIVKIGGTRYFVDSRLNELRNIKNPNDREKMEASEEWYINEFGE